MQVRAGWVAVCPVGQSEEPGWLGGIRTSFMGLRSRSASPQALCPCPLSALTELPGWPSAGLDPVRRSQKPASGGCSLSCGERKSRLSK